MKSINRAFVLMVFLCHAVWAQQTIKSIVVEGNQRIRDDAIEQNLRSKAGEILRRSDIQEDIKRIFRMGYFENVEVYFNENTQTLEIFVVEKKFIRSLKFEGNKEKDSEDLLKEIQVKPFTYLNRDQIEEDIVKLKVLYESKGYYLVDIEPVIQEVNTGEVDIVYKIQENKKVKVTRINFVGNSIFTESELKKVLFTKEKSFLSFLSGSGNFQIEILEQDRQMLWDFYRQHGYFRSVVNPASVTLSPDRRNIAIVFNLEEGEQYRFGKIDIDGELIKEREELEKLIESKEGEIANSTKLQKDVQSLTNVYADEGYAYANIVPQDHFDDEKKVVGWTFLIQPGQKVNIGKIKISGNTSTRDKVIRREMRIVEGEQYSWQKIRQSRENLERLAIFEEVRITTPKGVRDDVIDIEINVKEKQTGTVSLGAGFSTLDSFQIIGKIEKRNVFGYGVDLTFDAQVGARTQVFNLQYRDEYFLDTKWGLTLNAFNIDRRYTSFDLTTRGVSAEVSYPLYTRGLERWRLGVAYSIVDKILGDLQPTVENLFRGGLISSVTTSLSRDTRNRVFEPSKGSLLRISEEVAGGPFAGD
ncbi:MAG: outer membrane protein assembly factor BamA, partial [Bdellovibrionales bacterium]|nr:outer membrane protein assembly factor BamA [Bdellovibrionales bacterium]